MKKINKVVLISFILSVIATIMIAYLTVTLFQEGKIGLGILNTLATICWICLSVSDFKRIKS